MDLIRRQTGGIWNPDDVHTGLVILVKDFQLEKHKRGERGGAYSLPVARCFTYSQARMSRVTKHYLQA